MMQIGNERRAIPVVAQARFARLLHYVGRSRTELTGGAAAESG